MAVRVETNPLEKAYAALLSQGLEEAGEALFQFSIETPIKSAGG